MIDAFIEQLNEFITYVSEQRFESFNEQAGYTVCNIPEFAAKSEALIRSCERLIRNIENDDVDHESLEELKFALYQSTPILSRYHDPRLEGADKVFTDRFGTATALLSAKINEQMTLKPSVETLPSSQKARTAIDVFTQDANTFMQYISERKFETVHQSDGAFISNLEEFSKNFQDLITHFESFNHFLSTVKPNAIDRQSLRNILYKLDEWFKTLSQFHEPALTGIEEPLKDRYNELAKSLSQLVQKRLLSDTTKHDTTSTRKKVTPKRVTPLWQGRTSEPSSSSRAYAPIKTESIASDALMNDITDKFSVITQYFTERKFEIRENNGTVRPDLPGFIAFTEKALSDLSILYSSYSQTKEIPEIDEQKKFFKLIDNFIDYQRNLHDPALTGILEPFRNSTLKLAEDLKRVTFSKKIPDIRSQGLSYTYKISSKFEESFNIYDAIPKFFITDQPWLDIPSRSSLTVLEEIAKAENNDHHENKPANTLLKLIDAYHALKKDDTNMLALRIKMLGFICRYAQDVFDFLPNASDEISKMIVIRTYNKSLYLASLYERSIIYDYFMDSPKKEIEGLEFSRSIEGGDNIEDIDPCCRFRTGAYINLYPLIEKWKHNSQPPFSPASFYLWLENHDDLTQDMKMEFTGYDPTQGDRAKKLLKTTRLRIMELDGDRVFVDQNLDKLNSLEKIEYTINAKHELYLNYNLENKQIGGNHPTIIEDGKPVLCAGHITIKNGKVTYIDNNSGHYQPTPRQLWQTLCLINNHNLISKGATLGIAPSLQMSTYSFSEIAQYLAPNPRYQTPPVESPFTTELAPHPRRSPN